MLAELVALGADRQLIRELDRCASREGYFSKAARRWCHRTPRELAASLVEYRAWRKDAGELAPKAVFATMRDALIVENWGIKSNTRFYEAQSAERHQEQRKEKAAVHQAEKTTQLREDLDHAKREDAARNFDAMEERARRLPDREQREHYLARIDAARIKAGIPVTSRAAGVVVRTDDPAPTTPARVSPPTSIDTAQAIEQERAARAARHANVTREAAVAGLRLVREEEVA